MEEISNNIDNVNNKESDKEKIILNNIKKNENKDKEDNELEKILSQNLNESELFKNDLIKSELKNRIKAVLYATSRELSIKEITRLVKKRDIGPVLFLLRELEKEYEQNKEPIKLINDNERSWKLIVREKYVSVVHRLVTQVELPKSVIETLAVIAWKAPVTQSEVIHVRTNKAYQHIKDLEGANFITTEKYGRTKLIKLTSKFFDYFDMDKNALKKKIQDLKPLKKEQIRKETLEEGQDVYDPSGSLDNKSLDNSLYNNSDKKIRSDIKNPDDENKINKIEEEIEQDEEKLRDLDEDISEVDNKIKETEEINEGVVDKEIE